MDDRVKGILTSIIDDYTKGILALIAFLLFVIAVGVWYPQFHHPPTVRDLVKATGGARKDLVERIPVVSTSSNPSDQ